MKSKRYDCAPGCPVEATLDLIDGKWKGIILYHLQMNPLRFGELRRKLNAITQRMLTKQLRALEASGLVTRTVFAEVPPRVEYELSEEGRRLQPVIEALRLWGEDYLKRQANEAQKLRKRSASAA
ncbi:MAG: winged helix-turn-helix transcriptional regulator [Pseudorhodoplanes sp.]